MRLPPLLARALGASHFSGDAAGRGYNWGRRWESDPDPGLEVRDLRVPREGGALGRGLRSTRVEGAANRGSELVVQADLLLAGPAGAGYYGNAELTRDGLVTMILSRLLQTGFSSEARPRPGRWIALAGAWLLGSAPAAWPAERIVVQMHIHGTLSEGRGRMVDHAIRAREAGVDVMWWSDHEEMSYHLEEEKELLRFDFEEGELEVPPTESMPGRGWQAVPGGFASAAIVDTASSQGARCMAVVGVDGAEGGEAFGGVTYYSQSNAVLRSFMRDIEIQFDARLEGEAVVGRDFAVHCLLSMNERQQNIVIAFLATDDPLPADTPPLYYRRLPALSSHGWTRLRVPLTEEGRMAMPYGEDLNLRSVSLGWFVNEPGYSSVLVDDFEILMTGPEREELLEAEFEFLQALPEESPTHFVGYETGGGKGYESEITHHINVFSEREIPRLPNYLSPHFDPEEWPTNLSTWAHRNGYVTSFNHLFSTALVKISEGEARLRLDSLMANGGYGCDLLEVGYPFRGRAIEEILGAWDELLRTDAFLTGIGTSDVHHTFDWDETPNRFVSYLQLPRVTPANILDELLHGRASFGDPLEVGADAFVELSDGEALFETGDVVVSHFRRRSVRCQGHTGLSGMTLAWITVHEDSADTAEVVFSKAGDFDADHEIRISDRCHVRVELRAPESGSLLLASNPVHFRREVPSRSLPGLRERNIVDLRRLGPLRVEFGVE